ncbi:hypothetical protein [Agromyces humi]|uniref:hypothetical protein n=1 Tax=Agromyces humi TaxID=1766800 RepID=UPI0013586390|nr:hypothetical protein [Agromyces humi]
MDTGGDPFGGIPEALANSPWLASLWGYGLLALAALGFAVIVISFAVHRPWQKALTVPLAFVGTLACLVGGMLMLTLDLPDPDTTADVEAQVVGP